MALRSKEVGIEAAAVDSIVNFDNFSFSMLKRSVAYALRFIHNCRSDETLRRRGCLKLVELTESLKVLVKISQKLYFAQELRDLAQKENLNSRSHILSLAPFLDEDGILRVGGRLQKSTFHFGRKHPIVLSAKHRLTYLIVRHLHLVNLHAGPQVLLNLVREKFWPLLGKNLVKKVVHECITCFRFNPTLNTPLMGNLLKSRVIARPPFDQTAVDYAGPFLVRDRKGRGAKKIKVYLCLFICLVTKALHLEVVTDLTTESFIAVLRRFASRRGKPSHIYSDNGKNFVGANKSLQDLANFLQTNGDAITDGSLSDEISWHFISAYSPHIGGIWEAGVKSCKFRLKRVFSDTSLTLENFVTLVIQIEGILNSRPITPLISDPNDLCPLTPSHFLIGRSLTSVPDADLTHLSIGRLSTYQYVQRLKQEFWSRWSKEYLNELQQRTKWKSKNQPMELGVIVLLKKLNLPPGNWILGRVIELHPGDDQIVRVVSIKTSSGVVKRHVNKIAV